MKNKMTILAAAATLMAPVAMSTQAVAETPHHRTYHRPTHRYYYRCKRSKGTTGLIAGAGAGGIGAAALGAGPVGVAAGAVGGGLLGRHLDKRHDAAQNRRNGC